MEEVNRKKIYDCYREAVCVEECWKCERGYCCWGKFPDSMFREEVEVWGNNIDEGLEERRK